MPSSLPSRVLQTAQQIKPKTRTSPEKQHCLCFSPFSTLRTTHTCFTAARHQDVDSVLHRSARLTRGSGDAENDTVLPISSDHLPHDAAFSPIDEHRIPSLRFDAVPNFKAQIEQHLAWWLLTSSKRLDFSRLENHSANTPVARRTTPVCRHHHHAHPDQASNARLLQPSKNAQAFFTAAASQVFQLATHPGVGPLRVALTASSSPRHRRLHHPRCPSSPR